MRAEGFGGYDASMRQCHGGCGKMLSVSHSTGYCHECQPELDHTQYDLKGVEDERKG